MVLPMLLLPPLCRWLLDSAERSQEVRLSIITSGLIDGLKHSISRHNNMNSMTPRGSYNHWSRRQSRESLDKRRVQRLLASRTEPSPKVMEKKSFQMQPRKPHSQSSLHGRPGFTPSIGSQHGSNHSMVSSTVEKAAHIARSSTRSSRNGATFGIPFTVCCLPKSGNNFVSRSTPYTNRSHMHT